MDRTKNWEAYQAWKPRTVYDGWMCMDGAGAWNFAEAIRTNDVKQDMTDN
jgi:hypothetical protein